MATRYFTHVCPKCAGDLGIVIAEPKNGGRYYPVHGFCVDCGYEISWALIRS